MLIGADIAECRAIECQCRVRIETRDARLRVRPASNVTTSAAMTDRLIDISDVPLSRWVLPARRGSLNWPRCLLERVGAIGLATLDWLD